MTDTTHDDQTRHTVIHKDEEVERRRKGSFSSAWRHTLPCSEARRAANLLENWKCGFGEAHAPQEDAVHHKPVPGVEYRLRIISARIPKGRRLSGRFLPHHTNGPGVTLVLVNLLHGCMRIHVPCVSSTLMPSVAIFIGRWGSWPGWMPLVLKSLSLNTWAHFILLSEAPPRALLPANVIFHNLSIESLEFKMREKVGLNVNLSVRDTSANGGATGMSTAKTNDLKPMWGEVFADSLLRGYEWWGYLQEDVLLGDVTVCIPPWLLSQADVISPYVFPMNTSGVFMLLRNREAVNLAWRQSADAAHVLSSPRYLVFDEWWGEARDSFAATLGREHEAGRLRVHTADSKKWWSHDLRERRPMAVCWRRIRNGRSALFVSAGNELPSLPCLGASGAAAREALLAGGERCFFHVVELRIQTRACSESGGRGLGRARRAMAARRR